MVNVNILSMFCSTCFLYVVTMSWLSRLLVFCTMFPSIVISCYICSVHIHSAGLFDLVARCLQYRSL